METELERQARIRANLQKMVAGGATHEEIQQYVESERITPEMEAARTPLSGVEKVAGGTQAALQGLTLSFGDELAGGLEGLLDPNKSIGEAIGEQRASLGAFRRENPKTALGLELAGAVLPAIATAGLAGTAPSAARVAAVGAGTGALAGYGSGEGGALSGDRVTRGVTGGALGGLLGAIAPKVLTTSGGLAGPGGQVTDDLVSRLQPSAASATASTVSGRAPTMTVQPSGLPTSPQGFGDPAFRAAGRALPDRAKARTLLDELERAGMGDDALAMNVGDDQTVRAVRAAANQPGSTAGQTVNTRLATQGGRLGEAVPRDIGEVTGMGGTPGPVKLDQMIAERSARARPLYAKAMEAGDLAPERTNPVTPLRLYHGSPEQGISELDRLAPRSMPDKANRMDSAGNWLAETPDEVAMFTRGFDDAGNPKVGGVYEVDATFSNPKVYGSFDELMDDFNRAVGRPEWVGQKRGPIGQARGVAPGGGDAFNKYLRDQGYDAIKVTEARGIDRPGAAQTYYASLDPKRAKIVSGPGFTPPPANPLGLDALMDSPMVQRAIRQAKAMPQYADLPDTDMRVLDKVYKNLGGKEQAAVRAGDGAVAHDLKTIRQALREEITSRNPAYGDALSTFSGESEMIDAFDTGLSLPSKPVGTTTVELGKTTDAGREAMRAGFATNLQQRAGARASNADLGDLAQFRDVARAVVGTPQDRERFIEAFGREKYDAMLERLMPKIRAAAQNAAARGNSTTTKQLLDALAFGDDAMMDALGQLATGSPQGALRTMASKAFSPMDRAYRLGVGKAAGETADLLTTKGTKQIRTLLDYLDAIAGERGVQRAGSVPGAQVATRGAIGPRERPR